MASPLPAASPLHRARRILVIRPRFLGDLVLTTPLLRGLRENAPAATIAYLVEDRYADLLRGHPEVDEVRTLTFAARGPSRVAETLRIGRQLRAARFDVAIDLFANPRTAAITRMSGAPFRVGGAHRGRGRLFTHHPDTSGRLSAVTYHLRHLEALGGRLPEDLVPRLAVTAAERERAASLLARELPELDRPIVGIHPGASWPGKRWTMAGFKSVLGHVISSWGARVLITHGPGEEERARELVRAAGSDGALLPVLGWRDLASVLSLLDLYVANDCGAMHVAAAVGTPTVGLFGPSDPMTWFPYPVHEGHRVAEVMLSCRPCPASCCGDRECLADLSAAAVISAADEAWRASGAGARWKNARRELARAGAR